MGYLLGADWVCAESGGSADHVTEQEKWTRE